MTAVDHGVEGDCHTFCKVFGSDVVGTSERRAVPIGGSHVALDNSIDVTEADRVQNARLPPVDVADAPAAR